MARDSEVRAVLPLSRTAASAVGAAEPSRAADFPASARLTCGGCGDASCAQGSGPSVGVPADAPAGHYRGRVLAVAAVFYFLGPVLCALSGGLLLPQPEHQLLGSGGGLLVGLGAAVLVARVLTRLRARAGQGTHG
jgi:hypothetical protein